MTHCSTGPTGHPVAEMPTSKAASGHIGPFRGKRLAVVLGLLTLAILPGEFGQLTRGLMTDAYLQVSAFVAATLLLFYGIERLFRFDIGTALSRARGLQVPISALLGSTPGCGGAVVVVAAYSSGHVGFGAVVATLTATMGDAAFLLIATRPDAALVVLPLSFVVGILSGYVVDRFFDIRPDSGQSNADSIIPRIGTLRLRDFAYLLFVIPGLVMGISQMLQMDLQAIYGLAMPVVGLAGTAVGLFRLGHVAPSCHDPCLGRPAHAHGRGNPVSSRSGCWAPTLPMTTWWC